MNIWRGSVAAVLLAVTGVVLLDASAAPAACGPVDIKGSSMDVKEGQVVEYQIDRGGCGETDYQDLVSGDASAFEVETAPTFLKVTAKPGASKTAPWKLTIEVERLGVVDDAVTFTLKADNGSTLPQAVLMCVRESWEDPLPWQARITLSQPALAAVGFTYKLLPGTASYPGDYSPAQGNGVIPAGQLSTTIPIYFHVDQLAEGQEWFTTRITSISGATIKADSCHNTIGANQT